MAPRPLSGRGRGDGPRRGKPKGRGAPGASRDTRGGDRPTERPKERPGDRPKPSRGAQEPAEARKPRARAEKRRDGKVPAAQAAKRERRRATTEAARAALRPESGWELLHGRRPVLEALRAGRPVARVLVAQGATERGALAELLGTARSRRVEVRTLPRSALDAEVDAAAHQGVAALVAPIDLHDLEELLAVPAGTGDPPFFLMLDAVTDPQNLGALARSADAAGCHGIVVPRHQRAPLAAAAVKASAGALEHIPVAEVTNLTRALQQLKASGLWCLGLSEDADGALFDLELADEPVCVVVGGEGTGLHRLVREACDQLLSIPMGGQVASLNASVAGALALFEVRRRRSTASARLSATTPL